MQKGFNREYRIANRISSLRMRRSTTSASKSCNLNTMKLSNDSNFDKYHGRASLIIDLTITFVTASEYFV